MGKTKKSLKIGNKVQILVGKDKGRNGEILAIFPKTNQLLVKGINLKVRHVKPKTKDKKGEITNIERPIDCSNVKIIDL